MKARRGILVTSLALLLAGVAAPASAGPTDAQLTVQAGSLSISVPSATANLGSRPNTVTTGTISGSLGQVQVNDARSGTTGWVASVISTTFVPVPANTAIAASAVSYATGVVGKTGTAVHTLNSPADLTPVSPVVTASAVNLDNSATWNPTITVTIPGGTAAGTYTATITHSVA